jgi:RNA methyltransferase, TrmH family
MKLAAEHGARRVESRQNARIKELRSALARGTRVPHLAVEGLHLVQEAVKSGLKFHTVFVRDGDEALLDGLAIGKAELLIVDKEAFQSATQTETPQGIAALIDAPDFPLECLFAGTALILIAGGLQDPGNLGSLVRSAEAFGATGIILLPGTVNLWNAKVLRASSGSAFRLPCLSLTADEAFAALKSHGVRVYAAVARSGVDTPDFRGPSALLLGNEGSGLPDAWIERADARITIPLPGPVESLNAMVAGSVLLYEAARQRVPL